MTSRNSDYSESALVEKPAMDLFSQLGWSVQNCFNEFDPVSKYGAGENGKSSLGRETKADIVLVSKLRPAIKKINLDISETVIDEAIKILISDKSLT